MSTKTDQIRALNDELRQHLLGGQALITPGIAALGQEFIERLVQTIAVFDDFCHANDPHEDMTLAASKSKATTSILRSTTTIGR
jgi:hypothetical protein